MSKSSLSGTKLTANVLTGEEICKIIETSAKAKVSLIEYGDLRLEFGKVDPARSSKPSKTFEQSPTEAALSDDLHYQQTRETIEHDEQAVKEDRLALMFIEDPLQAEKLLTSGELDIEGFNEKTLDI